MDKKATLNQQKLLINNSMVVDNNKTEEVNYEKLYMNIVELKQECQKTLHIFSEFFKGYMDKNEVYNPKDILSFINLIEQNKELIGSNLLLQKKILQEKNNSRMMKIDAQNDFIRNYINISNVLNKNKRKYVENVLMCKSETVSLYFYIENSNKIKKNMTIELALIDENITRTKIKNKSLYAREYDLIHQILLKEKKILELVNIKEKNLAIVNTIKGSYQQLVEKMENLEKLKNKIIVSNQRKRIILMRKAYKLKKFNQEHQITNCTNTDYLASKIKLPCTYTESEAHIFSVIFDNLKNYYIDKNAKLLTLEKENNEKIYLYEKEKEEVKNKIYRIFIRISSNYSDIKILNFTEFNLFLLHEEMRNLNSQICAKKEGIQLDYENCRNECDVKIKNIKSINKLIVEKFKVNKKKEIVRNCFKSFRNVVQMKLAKRRKEINEKLEQDPIQKMRLKKESEEIQSYNPNVVVQPKRQISRKNQSRDKNKNKENVNINIDKINNNDMNSKLGNNNYNNLTFSSLTCLNKNDTYNYLNYSNNIPQNNISSTLYNPNKKYNFKVDLSTVEESFSKKELKDTEPYDILQEISKNLNEVNEFTFGDKKKHKFHKNFL